MFDAPSHAPTSCFIRSNSAEPVYGADWYSPAWETNSAANEKHTAVINIGASFFILFLLLV
jgi:hypothetical protein